MFPRPDSNSYFVKQGSNSSLFVPIQQAHPETVQSATEYFEEMKDKVLKNLPEKTEKSLEYWIGRTGKKRCNMHPSKLSKTCR